MTDTSTSYRTLAAGALRAEHAGQRVRLAGWVHRRRDLGGLIFIDLRDRAGRAQLSFDPAFTPAPVLERGKRLGAEFVIAVEGEVVARPAGQANPDMPTGEVEVHVVALEVLSEAVTPPIPVARTGDDELPAEDLRLRYRYLDLRREELQHFMGVRHRAFQAVRRHLTDAGFWEMDTPMLTRRTPEGARDYLVPSRVHPGEFYALPQSPQIYKQLLMVSGYDRYFQIARCLRDEDLRADRQPEFTQIDAEMSFVSEEDVFAVGEAMIAGLWREVLGVELPVPFPRLSYAEALDRYGTDKPDLRFGMPFMDVTDLMRESEFRLFRDSAESGARVRGIVVDGGAELSRKELDELANVAKAAGAAGALWVKRTPDGLTGQFAKGLDEGLQQRFFQATSLSEGDLFVAVVGHFRSAVPGAGPRDRALGGAEAALDALRRHLGDRRGLRRQGDHAWAWITGFPLFEWDGDSERLVAAHHPFTAPAPEDVQALLDATAEGPPAGDAAWQLYSRGLRSRAYDAVYNGNELASGSIRIHDPALQRAMFAALGIAPDEAERRFGFLLEAFRYGVPPHGGFAFGFDRLVMLMVGAQSLRDVIAFPKTTAARALFEGAPSPVEADELAELHIGTISMKGAEATSG
ncbi:MAG TPA: aspartate--tRNA ligase [Longimicrobiales bacterium]|nr:aspartate--tRNA ligase [Longimicrobiales bacterium]